MATTFYPTSTASTATSSTWSFAPAIRVLSLSRGSGVVSVTDNTAAVLASSWANGSSVGVWGDNGNTTVLATGAGANWPSARIIFVTEPLNAFTLAGSITINIRALENNAMANYVVGCQILKVAASGGAQSHIAFANLASELGTTEAVRSLSVTPSSTSILDGERLVLAIGYAGIGGSASGFTATGFYNGTSGGASGDTFITFTETITEQAVADTSFPYIGGGYYG